MDTLQLGIDIGCVIAQSDLNKTQSEIRDLADQILNELDIFVVDEPTFILGLGYGMGHRLKMPRDEHVALNFPISIGGEQFPAE